MPHSGHAHGASAGTGGVAGEDFFAPRSATEAIGFSVTRGARFGRGAPAPFAWIGEGRGSSFNRHTFPITAFLLTPSTAAIAAVDRPSAQSPRSSSILRAGQRSPGPA